MIFLFDNSIITTNQKKLALLAECLKKICRDGHQVENNATWRNFCEKVVLDTNYLGQIYIDEIHKNHDMLNVTQEDKTTYRRITVGTNGQMYNIIELSKLLCLPSEVALENETYDGSAIRKWVECYIDEPQFENVNSRVYQAILRYRLKFHHAGGGDGTIRVLLENVEPQFGRVAKLKLTTIFDSDKGGKDEDFTKNASLKTFLEGKGYQYHCLEKREMENYFPLRVYEECDLVKKNQVVPKLSEEDWDYYKIPGAKFLSYQKSHMKELAAHATKVHFKGRLAHQHKFPSSKGEVDEIQYIILLLAQYV